MCSIGIAQKTPHRENLFLANNLYFKFVTS